VDGTRTRGLRRAGGFRDPSNFTTAIYFHCGGLDLIHADPGRGEK